ncbi:restriction endonuclease subunit S [Agrobacterium vitis]|uniref:restriction endonuclease subunit S n=1 Tax=Agrobacterium vitis TaxID=373 RepID=UPI0015DA86A4|nr:restriction endonuclease subunit S [Agrobacterium vitis]MCF1451773.1 restriction endonuclease subunit S [Agrobacterium vitis]BCH53208.1 hypothetical protein RvVAR031_08180 [Agrobacterium vitis]
MTEWQPMTLQRAGVILLDCVHATPQPVEMGYPYVAIPQMKDGHIDFEGARQISAADFDSWTKKARPQLHDVVLSRRTNPGVTAVARDGRDFALGQNLVLLRSDGSTVLPQFLRWLARGPVWWEQIEKFMNVGAVFNSLRCADVPKFLVAIPPKAEQERIAAILDDLDDKIELNRRMNETLEAMAQAVFRDWFVDFGPTRRKLEGATDPLTIMGGLVQDAERAQVLADLFPATMGDDGLPEGWKKKALLEEARLISGGTPKTDRQDYWDGGIPWASAKDVSQCGEALLLGTERNITQSGLTNSSTKMVPKFSTVVVARGATTGRYCMFAEDMAMNQTCYALNSASGRPFLLYNMFGALIGELVQAAHGSVFDTITTKTLATGFVIDAEGVSAEFEKTAAPLYKAIENNSRQNRTLAATRDLLLPKLMSGEIRLSEAEGLMEAAQ